MVRHKHRFLIVQVRECILATAAEGRRGVFPRNASSPRARCGHASPNPTGPTRSSSRRCSRCHTGRSARESVSMGWHHPCLTAAHLCRPGPPPPAPPEHQSALRRVRRRRRRGGPVWWAAAAAAPAVPSAPLSVGPADPTTPPPTPPSGAFCCRTLVPGSQVLRPAHGPLRGAGGHPGPAAGPRLAVSTEPHRRRARGLSGPALSRSPTSPPPASTASWCLPANPPPLVPARQFLPAAGVPGSARTCKPAAMQVLRKALGRIERLSEAEATATVDAFATSFAVFEG